MSTKMSTGISTLDDSYQAGVSAAQAAVKKLQDRKPDMAYVFCSNKHSYSEALKGIRSIIGDISLIGCSSSGEFTEEKVVQNGVCCALFASDNMKFFCGIGEGVKEDPLQAITQATHAFPKEVKDYPHLFATMCIDGLAGKGEELTLATISVLGPTVRLAGGAAGDNLQFKETQVFYNNRSVVNALSMCLFASKKPFFMGVKHGHCPISIPLTITKSQDHIVYEIEGRPAYDVWKDCVRNHIKAQGGDIDSLTNPKDIGSYLLQYEAGLLTGTDYKVRLPFSADLKTKALHFGCTMFEGSVIRIMESPSKEAQIESARQAATIALSAAKDVKIAGALVFDCACRGIILGNEFYKGINAIKEVIGDVPLLGFETYGEIAVEIGQLSGFHNTTSVVVLIPE